MLERKVIIQHDAAISPEEFFRTWKQAGEMEEEDRVFLTQMLQEAGAVARPRAVYGVSVIGEKGEDYVVADEVRMESSLVRENLDSVNRIIPFVVTCGTELEEWSRHFSEPLEQYWADSIKMQYLAAIRHTLAQKVKETYFPASDMSSMNPGSLASWPLTEQKTLFRLIGGVTEDIGVRLTDSCLMLPSKSSSGFFFSSKVHYENCQFCPIDNCPGRRAKQITGEK